MKKWSVVKYGVAFLLVFGFLSSAVAESVVKAKVEAANQNRVNYMSAEYDPMFFSQNVVRTGGPKADDWTQVIARRVKAMRLQRFRIMVLPTWFEPVNDNDDAETINWKGFTWNSPEMESLYAELSLAQRLGMHVNLTLWGAPINHFIAGKHYGSWVVAPENNAEWAENFSALIQYLIKVKHFTCVDEITPVNEPNWAFFFDGKAAPAGKYVEMCRVLDARFRKDGIRGKVKFILSDDSDGGTHEYFTYCAEALRNIADGYNSHTYMFGYATPNSEIYAWEKENCRLARAVGKTHYVGEFGSNQCVGAARQKDINRYERGVLLARIALNCLNAGATGLSYWSLADQYYDKNGSYEQMQQLGLWKSVKKDYAGDTTYQNLQTDYEVRPHYYAYSLLTRFVRTEAEVHPIPLGNEFRVGTAFKNKNGKWTYIFANATDACALQLSNAFGGKGDYKMYCYAQNELPKDDNMLPPLTVGVQQKRSLTVRIPALAVVVLTQK